MGRYEEGSPGCSDAVHPEIAQGASPGKLHDSYHQDPRQGGLGHIPEVGKGEGQGHDRHAHKPHQEGDDNGGEGVNARHGATC